jgi:hypothetical protein
MWAVQLAAVAVAGVLVLCSTDASAQLLPPGPLSNSHAKLESGDQCHKCHSREREVSAAKCLACHTALAGRIAAGKGFHGRNAAGKACQSCHMEHRGRGARLVTWPGGSSKRFDHGLAGWALAGRHRELDCARCHKARNSSGGASYLGNGTSCLACHQDGHDGRYGTKCETCHSPTAWDKAVVAQFDHDLAPFRLKGRHLDVACTKCHGDPPRYRGLKFAACSDCHEKSPHTGRDYAVCETCHMTAGWHELTLLKQNHPGTSLNNGHAAVACTRCHDSGLAAPPTTGAECVSCHGVVHDAPFGRSCEKCHSSIMFHGLPRKVALDAHGLTDFPLRGEHAKQDCDECHLPRLRRQDRWRNLQFSGCAACHEDHHTGQFAARDGGECGQCHQETGFFPTTFGVEQHATTAFPLKGRHIAVPCSRCHDEPRPRVSLHARGTMCADCHQSQHGDQFAAEMAAGGCAYCHSTKSWNTPYIAHKSWPRSGAHAEAKCVACHSPTPEDRRVGRGPSYRGLPRTCDGCHEDPHAGQFRLGDPVRSCDHCHGTERFEITGFDHEKLTGHALEGRHTELECSKCHPTEKLGDGRDAVRWRLGYRNCRSCHADPHSGPAAAKRAEDGERGGR